MTKERAVSSVLLLALIGVSLVLPDLDGTTYGGWPALGLAVALCIVAGPAHLRLALAALVVVSTACVLVSYDLPLWSALLGSLTVALPAWLAQRLLLSDGRGHLGLTDLNSGRYHAATALSAVLCGLLAMLTSLVRYQAEEVLLIGALSFLAGLTAQLAVLPLLILSTRHSPMAGTAELVIQRLALVLSLVLVFGPTARLSVVFVIFPVLGWAALRATRREVHAQLALVCLTAYGLALSGHGPFLAPIPGVPDMLVPGVLYLFVAAACYMTVPLTMFMDQLVQMSTQATRSARTTERLLDSASGALIIATDARGRITHFNNGAQQMLGYSLEEIRGRSPAMLHTQAEIEQQAGHLGVRGDHTAVSLEMVRTGERRDWEFRHKNGSPRMASLTVSAITDGDGTVLGYIGAGDDTTDRLRAQEALTTALEREHASVRRLEEVDRVKQELVSNVSHELRTPITSIAGYAELLVEDGMGELNREQADALHRIVRNTQRLGLLVEDLLTLSRAESGMLDLEHDEVDLRRLSEGCLDLLAPLLEGRALDLSVLLPQQPLLVVGDRHALERVLLNLLSNAIKFTPDGGQIALEVADDRRCAWINVRDTGLGIAEEDQEHLFTRFYRTAAASELAIQGTGLGLSIVHSIVTQHGGAVTIDSGLGVGTTVKVRLPMTQQ